MGRSPPKARIDRGIHPPWEVSSSLQISYACLNFRMQQYWLETLAAIIILMIVMMVLATIMATIVIMVIITQTPD